MASTLPRGQAKLGKSKKKYAPRRPREVVGTAGRTGGSVAKVRTNAREWMSNAGGRA